MDVLPVQAVQAGAGLAVLLELEVLQELQIQAGVAVEEEIMLQVQLEVQALLLYQCLQQTIQVLQRVHLQLQHQALIQ